MTTLTGSVKNDKIECDFCACRDQFTIIVDVENRQAALRCGDCGQQTVVELKEGEVTP